MEQEGRENRQVQPQRGAAAQQQQQQQQQPQPPHQNCPRCDSTNTKFCYFNNYSLSQPRHYCKTCKRYWTHGGTFRNIPIGGGSRKGKRATITKSSSSAISSLMSQTVRPSLMMRPSPSPPPLTMVHSSTSPYYNQLGGASVGVGVGVGVGGTGYLPSFPTFRPLNTSQPLNLSTTLPFSGFNAVPALQPRFHQMGNGGLGSLYPPAQQGLIPSRTASQYPIQRPQSLINNGATTSSNHRASSHASLWNAPTINANSIMGNSNSGQNNVTGGSSSSSSLIPNHWLHLPGYGPPKQ